MGVMLRCLPQRGRLAMTVAGKNFLLCAYSGADAPAGLLKAKVMNDFVADAVAAVEMLMLWVYCAQVEALGTYLTASLDQIEL